tara:strand:- start:454 stop:993 length:540 start_codon:yes stop_codon:yes gene_type:complete
MAGLLDQPKQAPAYRTIMEKLKAKVPGAHPNTVAGILGNIHVETGGTFDPNQKQDGGDGFGLFQFDYVDGKKGTGMRGAYEAHIKAKGIPNSADAQLDFMIDSVYNKKPAYDIGVGNARKLRASFANGDHTDVSDKFQTLFERPGTPHRDRRQRATLFYATEGQENPLRKNLLDWSITE